MSHLHPSTPIESTEGISAKDIIAYHTAGVLTVRELLETLPKRHEDRRRFDPFPVQASSHAVSLRGTVIDTRVRRLGGRKQFYEAIIIEDEENPLSIGKITCRWFNMPWMKNALAAGHQVILYGKPKEFQGRIFIDHPEYEIADDSGADSIHLERIVPVYKNIAGIPQRRRREHVYNLLETTPAAALAPLYDVDPSYPRHEALREAHFPESIEHAAAARRHFALEEFFFLQLKVAWKRQQTKSLTGHVLGKKTTLLTAFYHSLPFDLTDAQKRSVHELAADMRQPSPMNRLLQGDVGSGKTFVALCAMLLAVDSGVQAALMAPTQILAEQHFLTFQQWLEPLGVRISLHTGNRSETTHAQTDADAQIIIGTHALLYENVSFTKLGLVIIDEQHKFGVTQRSQLIQQGIMPDVLVMTATPIPRTLTLTIYGDLDVSILDERPAGRGTIHTSVRKKPKVTELTQFLKQHLAEGRQAYIVYPLVDESEKLKVNAATVEYEKWKKRLSKYEVGLLHGKLKPEEKESIMANFRDGSTHLLIATTVIEVGVDVPNANIMIIHNAERFGLAQLHQLRGRIGRGEHDSHCLLVTDGKSPDAMEKLQVLADTTDGFKIAEADLRLRGPGDVLGTEQSGLTNLRFIDFLTDTTLIHQARQLADSLLEKDSELKKHPHLIEVLEN
ncbi:MAG: ATP-dependent DNA helicase RecG, partial [Akkermansiaceae bacterium]